MSRAEMAARGWDELDVLLVTGDAYVDHPSFGMAVIGRVLEAAGWRVGIVAQPDWTRPDAFGALGRPRLFVGVTAGAMDSMVANYTANKMPRRDDAYTPGGASGKRPNYATIVYTNVVRSLFPGVPVVIGGIEASLRRFAHYDYWKDRVRRSILLDSKADLLVAGMGEAPVLEIARRLDAGEPLHGIPGTVESYPAAGDAAVEILGRAVEIPPLDEVVASAKRFLEATVALEKATLCNADRRPVAQRQGDRLVVEWPHAPTSTEALDSVYALPYQRRSHPSYAEPVPALAPVQFSVVSHRGCFGGCSFCALSLHQGRRIVSRSAESVLGEIERLTRHPDFHGTISDVGGPTANMYRMTPRDAGQCAHCGRTSCVHPALCRNLRAGAAEHLALLRGALAIAGVKHVFIASGVRHDLIVGSRGESHEQDEYLEFLAANVVGGHLSVAPEHVTTGVLTRMRKPSIESFVEFERRFLEVSARLGREQYVMPYFIASFPGSTDGDMAALELFLKQSHRKLRQIQDFLPAPMTLATAMYHSGLDPETMEPIYVARTASQRARQREALLYHEREAHGGAGPGRSDPGTSRRGPGGDKRGAGPHQGGPGRDRRSPVGPPPQPPTPPRKHAKRPPR
jgi:uncharacterized radical SAM protein YgiQ